MEVVFFGVGIIMPLLVSIIFLSLGSYHPKASGTCWVGSDPFFCRDSYVGWCKSNKTWGDNFRLSRLIGATVWIGLTYIIILMSMFILFITVRQQEVRVARWSSFAHEGRSQKAVVKMACGYLGAYMPSSIRLCLRSKNFCFSSFLSFPSTYDFLLSLLSWKPYRCLRCHIWDRPCVSILSHPALCSFIATITRRVQCNNLF